MPCPPYRTASWVLAFALLASSAQAQQLLLRLQQNGPLPQQLAISQAQKGSFALQAARPDALEGELWVVGRDAEGQELFRQATRRPSQFRAELFDPRSGQIQQAKELSGDGALELRLPYPENLASIELQEQRSGRVALSAANALKRLSRAEIEALADDTAARSRREALNQAAAASTAMLWDSGPTGARMDLILIGDGFTAAEMARWQSEARRIADGILADPLFARHKNALNIRRVDVVSAQSGVSEGGVTRNTALGVQIGCYGMARLVCVNESRVLNAVSPVTAADGRDVYLVVANSTTYGGAALGNVGTMTLHPQSIEVALHEIGHSAFYLADEYDYGTCSVNSEPSEANVTRQTARGNIKWRQLIQASTPVPTQNGSVVNGTVGLFQGGKYCTSGVYRPTENSRMRALGNPWHAVNEARAKAVFDAYTGPTATLPSISSQPASLTVDLGRSASFSVTANGTGPLSYQWRRNGTAISGANAAGYSTPATTAADNGASYSVVVSNSQGSVTSSNALLTVRSGAGGTKVSGNLSNGGRATYPSASPGYHQSQAGGSFTATLSGPAAPVDFELFLYRWNGSAWAVVAKSEGPTSQESISYSGSAGYYYWEVKSYSGSGAFTLSYSLPN